MQFSKDMRGAPKDGRLILIDTFPEAKQPVAAFWSGKWWKSPAGGWVNAGVEVRMSKAGVELVPGPGFDAKILLANGTLKELPND